MNATKLSPTTQPGNVGTRIGLPLWVWRAMTAALWIASLGFIAGCGSSSYSPPPPPPPPQTNPSPSLATGSLNPSSSIAGDAAFTLTVTGSNFVSSSVVQWNGSARTTTFVSSTTLQAAISATDIANVGTATVTVITPAPGGGTSTALSFAIKAPAPKITLLSPSSAVTGSASFTLTVTGSNFSPSSSVQWKGSPRTTVFLSATSLQASIDSSDIAGAGVAAVTVANPPDSGGLSAPSTFFVGTGGGANFAVIAINQAAQDIVYDPVNAVFYLSVTGTAAAHPNTISVLDPATATITSSQAAGSNPNVLAISDDSQFLYAGIDGAASVQRFTLPALHTDISYPLGAAPSGSTFFALDLQVAPGMPHTTAVSLGATGSPSAQGGITIFDDATSRPTKAPGFNNGGGLYASIQWSSDATALFAGNNEDSGFDFYTLAVNSSGVSLSQDFQADFNSFSNNIHFDAGTKFVYADDGHAINPASGLPIGNFNTNTLGAGVIVPDSNLNTAFFISAGAGSTATIQSFDLTHFTPIASITIPNVTNGPIRLIRWAQNGLAFITGGAGVGQVFLVGGSFISPAPPFALTPPPAPAPLPTPAANAPVITKLNPGSAIQGGPAFTLTVTGANFIASSTLQWHGAALATTFDSSTQLHATVASANISTPGTVSVTVANPPASGGLSAPSTFFVGPTGGTSSLGATFAMVTVSQASKDLAYDPLHREIFLSVPEGTAPGNTISVLDLATATIVGAQFAGSNPDLLAMSGDSQFLYAALDGSSSVQRFALPSLDLDINYSLGTAGFFGPQFALDLGVAPGAPHTTAVTLGIFSASPNAQGGLKVFDDATVRPTSTNIEDLDHLAWGADATTLFSTGQLSSDLFVLSAISSGVAVSHDFAVGIGNTRLHFDAGTKLVYSDTGRAVDPSVGTQVGTFNTSGLMVPDSTLNKAFFLISTFGSPTVTINSFDLTTFTQIDSIIINNVTGTPQRLIRWGQNGLAFNTDGGQIFLLGGNFVH